MSLADFLTKSFREEDHPRDARGRFVELQGIAETLLNNFAGEDISSSDIERAARRNGNELKPGQADEIREDIQDEMYRLEEVAHEHDFEEYPPDDPRGMQHHGELWPGAPKTTDENKVLEALGSPRKSGIQGQAELDAGALDPAVARELWYLPYVGPPLNDEVRAGADPAAIAIPPSASPSGMSQTFREAYERGESSIRTWADVLDVVDRDSIPLTEDVTLTRGTHSREPSPKVGDVVGGKGMTSLTSDPSTADAFARALPPPAAQRGADVMQQEMMDHLMSEAARNPNINLEPGERASLWNIRVPKGTPLWPLQNDLEEFVLPDGFGLQVTQIDEADDATRISADVVPVVNKARRPSNFEESEHPRGADGRFISIGDRMQFAAGVTQDGKQVTDFRGTVARTSPDGRLVVNAGTSSRPKWVFTRGDQAEEIKRAPAAPSQNRRTWASRISAGERDAVIKYKENGYRQLNAKLRKKQDLSADMQLRLEAIDSAIMKGELERDVRVYRGFKPNHMPQVGEEFVDHAFVSASEQTRVPLEIAQKHRGVLARINLKAGQHAAFPDAVKKLDEREVLLPRSTTFRITGTSRDSSGVTILDMEPVT